MSTQTLRPLEPYEHVVLDDGNQFWFSEAPVEVDPSNVDPIYLVRWTPFLRCVLENTI